MLLISIEKHKPKEQQPDSWSADILRQKMKNEKTRIRNILHVGPLKESILQTEGSI